MNRLHISTRGIGNWRERLAKPETQWRREYSAMETAVSWEGAAKKASGLPDPIENILQESIYKKPELLFAVAEHQVDLPGGTHPSQCDVWALINSTTGQFSLSVEAKAEEPFGKDNETLSRWLSSNKSEKSKENREERWAFIRKHLPTTTTDLYLGVAYQILHRCAAAVIEAKRLNLNHAVFLVQAFKSPQNSYEEFSKFCVALNCKPDRNILILTKIDQIHLGVGWIDCLLSTDREISAVA